MKLYNTLTRSVEEFKPQNKTAGFYSCGPTVYDYLTIGNWTAYIRWDVLARALSQNYDLDWYMNITDVGHLVSDGDEGEDKLEKGAKREGKTAWEVAQYYTNDFLKGLKKLNISIEPGHLVKATDNIPEQIELIKTLKSKGYTYILKDGVYFDSTKFPNYGKMARLDIEGLQAGARVSLGQKKNSTDFALWKFTPPGQKRNMEWGSPWGKGFPGWHIECSAMAMKFLGNTIDIHSGGIDHIAVHHTNEIAQSEAATGAQFARYWLHSNFLKVNDTRIAKSLGNGYTLQDLEKTGYSAMDFRMFTLQSHYRTEANFTWQSLGAARTRLKDLRALADLRYQATKEASENNGVLPSYKKLILKAVNDNLNTPEVLSAISSLVTKLSNGGLSIHNLEDFNDFIGLLDELLGFELSKSSDITDAQKEKINQRSGARQNKNWDLSDKIRNELTSEGIGLNDATNSTVWHRL